MLERLFKLFGYEKISKNSSILEETMAKAKDLAKTNEVLKNQNEVLTKDRDELFSQKNNLLFQQKLIAKLLSDKDKNEHLKAFHKLIYEDFMDFANSEDSLPNEAQMFIKLQSIERELQVAISCAEIYNKNIIAVAGSFSSGKSAFISSFFADKSIALPQDIKPSTAISTFVLDGASVGLYGVSNDGDEVNLSELDREIHKKMNHELIQNFGFRLKKLMPFMMLRAPLKDEAKHLCFIDTPGYNPATNEQTKDDEASAREFLADANALIWLISAQAGTISQSDLEFLNTLDLSDKKLFILLNKADSKPQSQLKEIAHNLASTLDSNGLDYEGISAYDSRKGEEKLFEKLSLKDFLSTQDKATNLQKNLVLRLYEVRDAYKNAICAKQAKRAKIEGELHSLDGDLSETRVDEKHFTRLKEIQRYFKDDGNSKKQLNKLEKSIAAMKGIIDEIFGKQLVLDEPKRAQSLASGNDDERYAQWLENSDENSKQVVEKAKARTTRASRKDYSKAKLNAMLLEACKGKLGDINEATAYLAKECGISIEKAKELYEAKMKEIQNGNADLGQKNESFDGLSRFLYPFGKQLESEKDKK